MVVEEDRYECLPREKYRYVLVNGKEKPLSLNF
jgi:hypothetical protein